MKYQMNMARALVLLSLVIASRAAGQNQNSPTVNGIVVSIAPDKKSFNVVDRSGSRITVAVSANTSYQANKTEVGFDEAVQIGMDVRGAPGPDGSVATVTARGLATQLNIAQLQPFLGATDEEWPLLKPKIDRIRALQRIADTKLSNGNNGGNNSQGNGNAPAPAEQRNPVRELQAELQNGYFRAMSPDQLRTTLDSLHRLKSQNRSELQAAQNELRELITTRQEVLLVLMGILD